MNRLIDSFKQIFKLTTQKRDSEAGVQITKETAENIELLTLSENSLDYYRKRVKGNKDISEEQARRKMTRNMILAFQYKKDNETKKYPRAWFTYGCLRFIVKNSEVTWIVNHQPVFKVWKKDWEKYAELNKKFRIDEKHIK